MTPGLLGEVAGYRILMLGDDVAITHEGRPALTHSVTGLEKYLADRPGEIRIGWGKLPDFEVLYLYDRRDGFGYAVNVDAPELSEWGYAPFEPQER